MTMAIRIALVLLGAGLPAGTAVGDLVLNGSFEDNTAGSTQFNLTNAEYTALMADSTAFGTDEEIDIMRSDGGYGPAAFDGEFKVGLANQDNGAADALSLTLSSPLVAGQKYAFSFYASRVVEDFSQGSDELELGVSTDPSAFGTQVFSTGTITSVGWQHFSGEFVAGDASGYLTVRVGPAALVGSDHNTWAHADAFSLTLVPTPATALPLILIGCLARRRRD